MSSVIYKFACPLCGAAIESTESVSLEENHEADGTLVHVRIHGGARVIHECARPNQTARRV
jgi:hypothetical protein